MKRILIAGLLVWAPLGITLWVLHFLVSTLDQTLGLLPEAWQPDRLLDSTSPASACPVVPDPARDRRDRRQLLRRADHRRLGEPSRPHPFVKSIYSSVKQVSDTLLSDKGNAFRKALLVEFPREGSWTIGFLTGTPDSTVAPFCRAST
jgi:uncharacterized membrane protein